jgi:hypothetical protein
MPLPVAGGPLSRRATSNRRRMDPSFLPTTAKEKPRATEVRAWLPWTG